MTSSALERDGAFELGLGLAGDDAACRAGKGFAKIGAPLGAVAVIGDRIAKGAHRVVIPAQPCVSTGAMHVPAAAIGRIFLQMRFDLRHQIVERLRLAAGVRVRSASGKSPRRGEPSGR